MYRRVTSHTFLQLAGAVLNVTYICNAGLSFLLQIRNPSTDQQELFPYLHDGPILDRDSTEAIKATVAKLSAVVLTVLYLSLVDHLIRYLLPTHLLTSTVPHNTFSLVSHSSEAAAGASSQMRWPLYHAANASSFSQTRLCRPSSFPFEQAFDPPPTQRSSPPVAESQLPFTKAKESKKRGHTWTANGWFTDRSATSFGQQCLNIGKASNHAQYLLPPTSTTHKNNLHDALSHRDCFV